MNEPEQVFTAEEVISIIKAHASLAILVNRMEMQTDHKDKERTAKALTSASVPYYRCMVPSIIRDNLPYNCQEVLEMCCAYFNERGINVNPQMSTREINEILSRQL